MPEEGVSGTGGAPVDGDAGMGVSFDDWTIVLITQALFISSGCENRRRIWEEK
ncbi:hypothetical protein U1Q18_049847, partial [Sarracenia purpurea var. burkii]